MENCGWVGKILTHNYRFSNAIYTQTYATYTHTNTHAHRVKVKPISVKLSWTPVLVCNYLRNETHARTYAHIYWTSWITGSSPREILSIAFLSMCRLEADHTRAPIQQKMKREQQNSHRAMRSFSPFFFYASLWWCRWSSMFQNRARGKFLFLHVP